MAVAFLFTDMEGNISFHLPLKCTLSGCLELWASTGESVVYRLVHL